MIVEHLAAQITAVLPRSGGLQSQYNPSRILTFVLNIWYLQDKINELIEASPRQRECPAARQAAAEIPRPRLARWSVAA